MVKPESGEKGVLFFLAGSASGLELNKENIVAQNTLLYSDFKEH